MNSTMQSLNSPLVSQNQHHQHSIHQQAYCFCWHYFALSMELISNLIYFLFSSPFCPCSIRVLNCQHNCKIGPSGVRALPLAAGIYEGGHYFLDIATLGPEERPILSQRDRRMGRRVGIIFISDQPASQPASQPATRTA